MNVPKRFFKKKFLRKTVVFNILFSIVFLSLYQPFSQTFWFSFRPLRLCLFTIAFYVCCVGMLLLSKELFLREARSRRIDMPVLWIWLLLEFAGIAVIYLAFTAALGYSSHSGLSELFVRTMLCVALILALPFVITLLYAEKKDAQEEVDRLRLQIAPQATPADKDPMLSLYDSSGVLRLSAARKDIFYVEAQENYVSIHYLSGDKSESYLLRNSTAEMEEMLRGTGIIRCHRSYLVNIDRIKLLKHSKGRATILLDDADGTKIPVSRSYYKELLEAVVPGKIIKST